LSYGLYSEWPGVSNVMRKVQRAYPMFEDPEEVDRMEKDIAQKLSLGWTEDEIFRMLKTTEDLLPMLPEHIALERQGKILAEIEARFAREKGESHFDLEQAVIEADFMKKDIV
jgi:hypothetical protein